MANAQLQIWADTLATANDFVTFVDLLGLCRAVNGHAHLPASTLETLLELRAAQPLTLGAQSLLDRTLSSYAARVRAQRRLAARGIRPIDANQLVRVCLHQEVPFNLDTKGGFWHPQGDPSLGGLIELVPEGLRNNMQRLVLRARAPGAAELVLVREQAHLAPARTKKTPVHQNFSETSRLFFHVLVETAEEAALFCDAPIGEDSTPD